MQSKSLFTVIAVGAMLGCASIANAADIIIKQPIHIAPAFSWAGPYLGVETGVVMTKFHSSSAQNLYIDAIAKPKTQPLLGLYTGFNIPIGPQAMLGLDANIDYHPVESISNSEWFIKYKESALAAARLRLGLAHGRIMPYIAGGLSAARAGLSVYNTAATPININKQKTYIGWNIGAGVDYAVTKNMFLRADYSFDQIKVKDLYIVDATNAVRQENSFVSTRSHQLRIGAAYKF